MNAKHKSLNHVESDPAIEYPDTGAHEPTALLTPSELAMRLRVQLSWIYTHADDLGVLYVGKYLRFRWRTVLERLDSKTRRDPAVGSSTQRPLPNPINKGLSKGHGTDSEQI
jgi:hypothetical protein